MTTSAAPQPPGESDDSGEGRATFGLVRRLVRIPVVREFLIIVAFCLFTSALTWPYVTRLRDAVAGPGDPYLLTWTLWWDYHQTFHDPLHLFHANVFYPYRYTLAFSEHCYGLALPFFILFALGFRPLTVHAVAMFLGFALSGYAAFRLARTLTGSYGIAWVTGIIFAFVPYRFNMMAQLVYLFSVWIPLVFEALILFARDRSRKRAAWLGFAFFMLGLTSISWFLLSLIPLAICGAILLTRYDRWREGDFWRRGAVAIGVALLGLMPFMVPYYIVSKIYGFKRRIDEVKAHSAMPYHWLVAEGRNKLWAGMGSSFPEAWKFQMFPGLMTLLLPLAELFSGGPLKGRAPTTEDEPSRRKWARRLDVLAVVGLILSVAALGFEDTEAFAKIFLYLTSERALTFLSIVVITRLCISYPQVLRRGEGANLIETLRSDRHSDAFWLGIILTVIGFLYSIGWNFFFYRILYDLMPGFKSMRAPMRGAVFAYLGLALLAGLGTRRLAQTIGRWRKRGRPAMVYAGVCVLLLVEFNAAPMFFIRGDVFPDAVTLRLKATPMRGGIAYLPAAPDFNQRYMLRAADHAKPLIIATSGFNPPYVDQIERMTAAGPVPSGLMDLLEQIPASYLVVANQLIVPERTNDYETFLARAVSAGRLRFINRFGEHDDLYAVVKNEPNSRSEAALPFGSPNQDWAAKVNEDPINLLGQSVDWSQQLYRIYLASSGAMPRYQEYLTDLETIGRGVVLGSENQDQQFQDNLRFLLEDWTNRDTFKKAFGSLDDAQYVDRLVKNAGISMDRDQRVAMAAELSNTQETRSTVLLKIVSDPRFIEKEKYRSLLLLHYFGYLRRNPDDPPDRDLSGFNFWLRHGALERLAMDFKNSSEYQAVKRSGIPPAR